MRISTASSSVSPSGTESSGGFGSWLRSSSRAASASASSCSARFSSSFTLVSSSSCSGRRLALDLRPAREARRRAGRRRASARRPRARRRTARPLPCARARRRNSSGSLRAARASIMRGSLGRRRSRRATPSCSTSGTTRSARARISSCAFATATPKPAQSRSSRSFSPSPHATVSAAVKPSRSATNWSPEPLFTSGCANSRKCGSDFETNRRPAKCGFSSSLELVERVRVADRDELRRIVVEPLLERSHGVDLESPGSPHTSAPRVSPRRRTADRRRSS